MTTQPTLEFPAGDHPPHARATDPITSHIAPRASKITGRALALATLAAHPNGMTDFELAAATGKAQTSIGCRRHDLVALGLVEATAERRATPSGATAIVWTVTAEGLRAAAGVTP